MLDLSNPDNIPIGTCNGFDLFQQDPPTAILLSHDPADYPMKIVLPALTAPDEACLEACPDNGSGMRTTFGVAIGTRSKDGQYLIGSDTGRLLAISVPPPWSIVSGGCGESCAWPCLEGYQEYGPRSCLTIGYGDFGFATNDPHAPSVEAVVELLDVGDAAVGYAPNHCCLYQAP
ncbi:Hypothetical protein A7982_10503 [Minicystis rosea]|nr:Hypothetical protein A7982_10503 [Minicystis rosea]